METRQSIPAMPVIPPERVKWARTGLQTNSSGVYSVNFGANVFSQAPVVSVAPKMATGSYDWRYQISGSAGSGFTVTVTFVQRKNTIDISLSALLNIGLIESSPGVVTFDMSAAERTA